MPGNPPGLIRAWAGRKGGWGIRATQGPGRPNRFLVPRGIPSPIDSVRPASSARHRLEHELLKNDRVDRGQRVLMVRPHLTHPRASGSSVPISRSGLVR